MRPRLDLNAYLQSDAFEPTFSMSSETARLLSNQKVILQALNEQNILAEQNKLKQDKIAEQNRIAKQKKTANQPGLGDAFLSAIKRNRYREIKRLLDVGVSINFYNKESQTGLRIAIEQSNAKMLRFLLKEGVALVDHIKEPAIWKLPILAAVDYRCVNEEYEKALHVFTLMLREYFNKNDDAAVATIQNYLMGVLQTSDLIKERYAKFLTLAEIYCYECILHNKPQLCKQMILTNEIVLKGEHTVNYIHVNRIPFKSEHLIDHIHIANKHSRVMTASNPSETLQFLFDEGLLSKVKLDEFNHIVMSPTSYYSDAKTYPLWLSSYIKDAEYSTQRSLVSIIVELQKHLESIPGPQMHELQTFIHPHNETYALTAMCMNDAVKNCILQVTVHTDSSDLNKKRCLNLLSLYEKEYRHEKSRMSSNTYLLAQMKTLFSSQLEQLKTCLHAQQLEINQLKTQLHMPISTDKTEFDASEIKAAAPSNLLRHSTFKDHSKTKSTQNNTTQKDAVLIRRNSSVF